MFYKKDRTLIDFVKSEEFNMRQYCKVCIRFSLFISETLNREKDEYNKVKREMDLTLAEIQEMSV